MACLNYTIVPTECSCLLLLDDGLGNQIGLNLHGAAAYQGNGYVHVITLKGGVKIADGSSGLSLQEIEELICTCRSGSVDEPTYVDISTHFVDCEEVVSEGLPVRVICDDSADLEIACTDDGQLVYVNLKTSPPTAFFFDGTQYTGPLVSCDVEYKWIERCFQQQDGSPVTQVICWEVKDITNTQTIWVLSDGTITEVEPVGLTSCDEVCDPFVADFVGDSVQSNSEPFNKINVYNPTDCCTATISTSAGDFLVLGKTNKCLEFECNLDPEITITSDSSECTSKIITTIQRTK